jgi:hypothetical protein
VDVPSGARSALERLRGKPKTSLDGLLGGSQSSGIEAFSYSP